MERKITLEKAKEFGFTNVAYMDIEKIQFRQEVRDMCADNKCGKYNKRWTCPPACGSLEEFSGQIKKYDYGILLQVTAYLEDDFDWENMQKAGKDNMIFLHEFVKYLKENGVNHLPMGSGGCGKCETCTYPDAPCRFPDELIYSMEACGLFVSGECENAGIPYYYGPQTITYSSCVFFKD